MKNGVKYPTILHHVALLVRSAKTAEAICKTHKFDPGPIEEFPSEGTREIYVGMSLDKGLLLIMEAIGPGPYKNALAWRDGTSHLRLSPHELLEKLAAIIPPPKAHLVRWGGVFAANSPFRKKIILKPEEKKGFDFQGGEKKRTNKSWSLMLARVFKIDVLKCNCGGNLTPLGAVQKGFRLL